MGHDQEYWERKWQAKAARWQARAGRRRPAGVLMSLLIIGVGVVLFLDNFGLFKFQDIWDFWPVILVVVGASKLMDSQGSVGRTWGALLLVGGSLLLANNLGILHIPEKAFAPMILIGFGAMMLMRALDHSGPSMSGISSDQPPSADSTVQEFVMFGGVRRRLDGKDFRGGEAIAMFGGIEIDLRSAGMSSKVAVVDANAMFGGVEIRVPDTWSVLVKGIGIFGGYEDKAAPPRVIDTGVQPPQLTVTGYAIFGGVTVRN